MELTKSEKLLYKSWIEEVDAWRKKFDHPFTRSQVCQFITNDSPYNKENPKEDLPTFKTLLWKNHEKLAYKYLENIQGRKFK